jgi:hypothetical protein
MTKPIDIDLILEMQERFGEVVAQALVDQLTCIPGSEQDAVCIEALQMAEIAHRLKEHVRDKIRECRELERIAATTACVNQRFYLDREILMRQQQIVTRDHNGAVTGGIYVLYKAAWKDFLAFFDACMHSYGKSASEACALKARASSRGLFLARQQRQAAIRANYCRTFFKAA